MRLLGAILAGGRSSRFGSDKAEALWRGKPLIEHAADRLRPVTDELILCGRSYAGLRALPDRPEADMGPLGGLNAALHHARAEGFGAVLSLGCDTPDVPAALFDRLLSAAGPVYVARLPVIGHWPAMLAADLDAFLADDRKHSIRAWAERVGAEPIDWPELANINVPADLATLRRGDDLG
ncbi:molybdopterin-guanine dinucleotide biosynthesis protein MobA [Sphingomonas sp. Root710]|uniref:molybdenum cofactor guanylyltransferase n=1 Tax=Sphingomonas sp. Root710 TaxID=1736594 RepID=UPI0006FA83DB|nr:molybdenum cofactor guanylyltransferase [Sphingomonas sp. Root710]KRB82249.1 molybdopterin-guanine dinucleotide biosynthesis protein MobA [Sphingomonas sp. Root710]